MREKQMTVWQMRHRFTADGDVWSTEPGQVSGWRLERRSHLWRPPTDVLETDEAFEVVVEVAGMRGADFSITYSQKVLSIRGMRTDTSARRAYQQMEIAYGEFATEVLILVPIDASKIDATYSDGFLRVVLHKVRPRHIPISE